MTVFTWSKRANSDSDVQLHLVNTVITDDGLDPDSAAKTKDLVKELVLAHQSETIEESE